MTNHSREESELLPPHTSYWGEPLVVPALAAIRRLKELGVERPFLFVAPDDVEEVE